VLEFWLAENEEVTLNRIGRPSVGTVRTVRIPDEHWAALLTRASQIGTDRTDLIRRYIVTGLREEANRYWEVPADDATGTIELYRGPSPNAVGTPLEEWLQDHSLDDDAWAWLREQGLTAENSDVWALYVSSGDGTFNEYFTCLPVGTHRVPCGDGCLQCGRPGPSDDFCDSCIEAGAATEIFPDDGPNTEVTDFFARQTTIKNVCRGVYWHHVWRVTPATQGMADHALSMAGFGQSDNVFVVNDRDGNPIIVQYNRVRYNTDKGPDFVENLAGIYNSQVKTLPESFYRHFP
jgi:hypothetical protein